MDKYSVNLKCLTRINGRSYSLKTNYNRFFMPAEYTKVYDILKAKQQHTVKCLINTGARINEIRHVVVSDIDFINRRMTLRHTKTKARKGEKVGRTRIIPISTQFARYLRQYVRAGNIGLHSTLNILSTPAANIGIKKAAKKAGIQDYFNFSAHSLRKTLEVYLLALDIDSLKITAHIGHDVRTAAQHYVSPDIFSFKEKQQMRLIIGDLYGG